MKKLIYTCLIALVLILLPLTACQAEGETNSTALSLESTTTTVTETITITDTTTETITITYAGSTGAINEIEVSPAPGNYLRDTHDEPLEVFLIDVQVERIISDRYYFSPWYPGHVHVGEPILVVNGTIRNEHPANTWISMFADGYDGEGEQVAWTLDAAHIAGQILRYLDNGETGEFTIHLNMAENIETIRIFADSYNQAPP
jgi:hypothetical protein